MDALAGLEQLLGGGNLTVWIVVAGVVLLWLAFKAVSMVLRLAAVAVAGTLFVSTAPWAGSAVDAPAAACASEAVRTAATGWQRYVTKRVTVDEVSDDASCTDDGRALGAGSAVVTLRTFFDLPFQTWDVDRDGAIARFDLGDGPSEP